MSVRRAAAIAWSAFGLTVALAVCTVLAGFVDHGTDVLERSRTGPRWAALVWGVALATAIVAFPVPAVAIPAAVCALAGLGSVGWIVLTVAASPPERLHAREGSR